MPKKHNAGQKGSGSKSPGLVRERVVSVPFSYINYKVLVSGSGQATLSPALLPRMLEIADAYDLYRITRLEYRALLSGGTVANTASWIMAFYPGIVDNPPASLLDISENLTFSYQPLKATVNGNWVKVPKEDLLGSKIWFKTIAGSSDPAEEQQGQLFFRASGAVTDECYYEIRGVMEFKGASNTGATPALRAKQELLREKQRLLHILETTSDDEEEREKPPPKPEKRTLVLPSPSRTKREGPTA